MKKRAIALLICAVMVISMSFNVFAAGWEHDAKGWKYKNDDGTYFTGGWHWIDDNKDGKSECYYFNDLTYILMNTLTPDGYNVNADGAWVIDQVVQSVSSAGPAGSAGLATPGQTTAGRTMDRYIADLTYQGVDGTEKATITTDGTNIFFEVVSGKSSAELTPEKAKEMYYGDDHYKYMQLMANAALDFYGAGRNVVETVKTSDGVEVYKYTYYGRP